MPRTDWKRMREDLARVAEVVARELKEAKVEAEIILEGTPPRIYVAMNYPEELHTAHKSGLKRDVIIEGDERHIQTAANFLAASKKVEEATKKYGLTFFREESHFEGVDRRLFAYGFHPKNYIS